MRVPLSWIADHADLPAGTSARDVADALVRVGLEVERVEPVAPGLAGPLVVGRVAAFVDEPQSNGKTIRWCQVEVGEESPRGIVCGARNFELGDHVVVALPGAVLPGGFVIGARRTYGHVSDGMICSARELAIGDDHTGILVLGTDDLGSAAPGADARPLLGLPDHVLDIAVTPDRGYCLSVRGIAREVAIATGVAFRDPGTRDVPPGDALGWPVRLDEAGGCDRFVARSVTGLDATARSPLWLRRRLALAGMRPISLPVDVTNYVMLELGQPIHGYDREQLTGSLVVRRAAHGESLTTLDGTVRRLDSEDLVIADDSGAVGVAGVMGGASTELSERSRDVVVEAAHFDPVTVARSSRRHRLSSEASRRFERGVDPDLPGAAADRVVELLCSLGGAAAAPGVTDVDRRAVRPPIRLDPSLPSRLIGVAVPPAHVLAYLRSVGCTVDAGEGDVDVLAPSWRPDLHDPVDLVEEVARLHGYDAIPSVLPAVRARRLSPLPGHHASTVARALSGAGFVEVRSYPFIGQDALDALGLPGDDERRRATQLANPLSDEEPLLRTMLLPGLLATARRNVGRGFPDLALFETGRVFGPLPGTAAPRPPVSRRPTDAELDALDAALPDQPVHLGVVLAGAAQPRGWWGRARPADWADAVDAARCAAEALGVPLLVRSASVAPWHPGRCAELVAGSTGSEQVVGHAGELHPRLCADLGLPARTCAAEVSLVDLARHAEPLVQAPALSTFPVATQDVSLVVSTSVPAADVESALLEGAGPLLESLRLFDVYEGEQVGDGQRSLAYTLRFRAPDRTLTADEAGAARDAAVDHARRRVGAVLRG